MEIWDLVKITVESELGVLLDDDDAIVEDLLVDGSLGRSGD
jgi:hypothetical protein